MYSWIILTVNTFKENYRVEIPQFSREVAAEVGMYARYPYRAVVFHLRGTAHYHDFGRFVADFENAFPYMRIQNIELDPSATSNANPQSDEEKLAFKMEIVTLVNPVTVLMLRRAAQQHFSVGFDGVVLNNAAASAVGRLFTAGAHHHQIVTISIVRNEARAEQLRDRFPEVPVVSTDSPDWTARVPRRRFGTVDLRRARPPSGVKHPQTCCRAVQIADVAGEQFGAAYRTPGLGLCLQHRHAPARVGKHRRGDQPVVSGSDDDGVNHTATRWHRGSCFCAIVASRQVHSGCGAPPRAAAGCPVASAVDG